MFERFTEPARLVVVLAREESSVLGHDHVSTGHLLLGLLREGEGTAARLLAGLDITLDEVRVRVQGSKAPARG